MTNIKISILTLIMLMCIMSVIGCFKKTYIEFDVYQNGILIDTVCHQCGDFANNESYSYGGSYYKTTGRKCK